MRWLVLLLLVSGCSAARPMATGSAQGPGIDPRDEISDLSRRIAERRAGQAPGVVPAQPAAEAAPAATQAPVAPPTGRCAPVCQAADEICGYSGRICQLAAQLADDDSRRSCRKAQEECDESRRLCTSCSP